MNGEMADLDHAISLTEQVLAAKPIGYLDRPACLGDSSSYYQW